MNTSFFQKANLHICHILAWHLHLFACFLLLLVRHLLLLAMHLLLVASPVCRETLDDVHCSAKFAGGGQLARRDEGVRSEVP